MNLEKVKQILEKFRANKEDPKVRDFLVNNVERSVLIIDYLLNCLNNEGYTLDKCGHRIAGINPNDNEEFICELVYDPMYGENDYHDLLINDIVVFSKISFNRCWDCAESGFSLKIDKTQKLIKLVKTDYVGEIIRDSVRVTTETECKYKDGRPPYSVRLNISSGVMLFANHFKRLFDFTELPEFKDRAYSDEFSINYFEGKKRCTEEYAKLGLGEFNIGNCGCHMYKKSDEDFFVGYDYTEYEDDEENNKPNVFDNTKVVGDVCTDFWGFCVIDKDTYEAKVGKDDLSKRKKEGGITYLDSKILDDTICAIKCTPGIYEFTHYYHLLKDGDPNVYTTIKLVEKK